MFMIDIGWQKENKSNLKVFVFVDKLIQNKTIFNYILVLINIKMILIVILLFL